MTQEQIKALQEARRILAAHFDAWVLHFKITDENLKTVIQHEWHGDITDVIGMNTIGNSRMIGLVNRPPPGVPNG